MGYQLGIDVGTTYTAAAVCRSSDRRWVEPETVTLGTRSATVPSVLFSAPDGTVLIGEAAERRALTEPDRVVREFKRRIGDPTPIIVGGRSWAPQDLSALLVRWVVDRVSEREGGPPGQIALTHPASWGTHKKELLAAALAGLGLRVSFLAEPQAAALHYATEERVAPGSTIAVYDLGGGTFDAAIVRKAERAEAAFGAVGFGLLGRPEGLDRLGGVDFDEVVFDHVREGLPSAFADLDEGDPGVLSAVARVRRECTEAKEALSADTEVSIPVLLPTGGGSVRLHRSEFEGLIREQIEETVDALRRAVLSAGCTPEALTAVLLVGGSSRIPLVAQLVSEGLGRPVAVDTDPKNAIAKGAVLSVSPQPMPSWPEVAIPPVGVDGGAAEGSVGSGSGMPGRSAGLVGRAGVAPGSVALSGAEGRGAARIVSLPHGPAGTLLSGRSAPPDRPTVHPAPVSRPVGHAELADRAHPSPGDDGWEPRSAVRRPLALLVGVGGLLVVVVIVLLAVLVPMLGTASSPGIVAESGSSSPAATTARAATVPAPAPAQAPAEVVPGGGSGPSQGSSGLASTVPSPRSSDGGSAGPVSPSPAAADPPATSAPSARTTVAVRPTVTAPETGAPIRAPAPGTTNGGEGSPTTQAPVGGTPVGAGSTGGSGAGGAKPVDTGSGGSSASTGPTAAAPAAAV